MIPWGPGTHQEAVDEIDRLRADLALANRSYEAQLQDTEALAAENARLRERLDNYVNTIGRENVQLEDKVVKLCAALEMIADYYGKYFQEGDIAYQAAIIARAALEETK